MESQTSTTKIHFNKKAGAMNVMKCLMDIIKDEAKAFTPLKVTNIENKIAKVRRLRAAF